MIKNYLKITLANIVKDKLYSLINVTGLSIGLAACILIGLYVRHELSYDRYHQDADRIYRIGRDFYSVNNSPGMLLATNAPQVAPLLENYFPEVEQATRIYAGSTLLIEFEGSAYYENRIRYADNNLFEFFTFQWLKGNPESAFKTRDAIVITESFARKYFGNEDPMGKVLKIGSRVQLQVTGVIKDLRDNTHLRADAFGSLQTLIAAYDPEFAESWGSNNFYTYVKLQPEISPETIGSRLPDFMNQYYQPDASSFTGMTLQPLTDIHLKSSHLQASMKPPGDVKTVITFIAIAICILFIACINFMNLSTARSTQRSREVGMRKAIGATRKEIITQFIGESLLSAATAMIIAIVVVETILPLFNAFIGIDLYIAYGDSFALGLIIIGAVLTGFVSGSYPAFFLSSFNSARVLRGDLSRGRSGMVFRNLLVVAQFAAAITLVVATAVIYLQLNYTKNFDLGFNKERILILNNLDERWEALKNELRGHPGILSLSASNMTPGENNLNALFTRWEGAERGRGMQFLLVDEKFFDTYGVKLLAGRDFSTDRFTDRMILPDENNPSTTASFILSEMAVRQVGWSPETAVNQWFELGFANGFEQSAKGPVIGVVDDIYFESLQTPVEPVVYILPPEEFFGATALDSASLRLSDNNLRDTLDFIDEKWQQVYPEAPITRRFLDDAFQALYTQQEKLGQLLGYFSILAIFIACLGLFGLASFNVERRTKEIGIRKVMGGSVWNIVLLLTNDFSKLVLISNVIAWPIAYFAMNRWLENFAYRIDLTPLIFIGSGLIALCIAWVTVGSTAAKAASAKPVLALRYE